MSEDRGPTRRPLEGAVALVAGGTRGGGRGIAVELGAAGATVYVSGRSTRAGRSDLGRPETIEETAALVDAAAGRAGAGIAVRCDHAVSDDVRALVARIAEEQDGRLDVLVNDVWGGDALVRWAPLWEHPLEDGLRLLHRAVDTHLITSHHALPLLVARGRGLVSRSPTATRPPTRSSPTATAEARSSTWPRPRRSGWRASRPPSCAATGWPRWR